VTWKDKLEIGLKEDAPYRKTICRRVKSVARKSRRDRADLLKSRWRVVTRNQSPAQPRVRKTVRTLGPTTRVPIARAKRNPGGA
jgi:hypothetical protein